MKLYFAENFLNAFAELPKGIQKKVYDFIIKFRCNSLSHSLHLEPISTFKDRHLRTARVDLKYRAIIYANDSGEEYYLLWVDNHDEAMQWASNKIFNWNTDIQTFQIYESKEINEKINNNCDFALCGKLTDKQLLSIGVPKQLIPSVKTINNFDDLEGFETYLPNEAFENLYNYLDGIPIKDLIKEIEDGKIKSVDINKQIESFNCKRNLFEVTDDKVLGDLLNGDLRKWKIFLHPTQRKIAESEFKGSIKVTGAAGTGKTVLALHRLKYLTNKCNKSKSILFTTYTKNLVNNLKNDVKDLGVDEGKIVICNIHHWVVEKIKYHKIINENFNLFELLDKSVKEKYWEKVCKDLNSKYSSLFVSKEYENIVLLYNLTCFEQYSVIKRHGGEKQLGKKSREDLWSLFSYFKKLTTEDNIFYLSEITNKLTNFYTTNNIKPFEHIIADEIQDFSIVELRLLRCMVARGKNDLFLTGDPLQKIYEKYTNFVKAGINIIGKRSKKLRVNYRTTEEIKRIAVSVINGESYDNFSGGKESLKGYVSVLHGEIPKYETFKEIEKMQLVIELLIKESTEKDGILFNEICIAARSKKYLGDIKTYLHKKGIPYYDVYEGVGDKKGIILSSFHNMKGLEYKIVILYNVSKTTIPICEQSEKKDLLKQKTEKALLYMAMSRAITKLYICGLGEKSCALQI